MIYFDESIPTTLAEAASRIVDNLAPEEVKAIQEDLRATWHHSFGMAMRNGWGLWHDSVLAKHFKDVYGLGHADDMSGLIMGCVLGRVRGEDFDVLAEVEEYKQHWRDYGVDPLTQEKI